MIYNIERTLEFLPYLSWGILALTLMILEVKNFKEMVTDTPIADPERGGFIPPYGEGYEYYVSKSTVVYILQKARNRFRVYLIRGEHPNARMKRDKHGTYFTVRCENTSTAEKIIDQAFGSAA